MKAEISSKAVVFLDGTREAGRYLLDDPFKPHLHPLRTPLGHVVTVCSPADHRHHKGLMFALRCEDLNFWEENPGTQDCGVQRIHETTLLPDQAGLQQKIRWEHEDGSLPTYDEVRTISVKVDSETSGYLWTFATGRTSLRNHRLIKSEWAMKKEDGQSINYHGLGIRLPWPFCVSYCRKMTVNGNPESDFSAVSGLTPTSVSIEGGLDGQWTAPRVLIELRQPAGQPCALYAKASPFPYLSLGISNLNEIDVSRGKIFSETYEILVNDLP